MQGPPNAGWTEVHEAELVQLLNRLRVLEAAEGDLRIFALPSRSHAAREQVHVLLTRDDTGGLYFPTVRHYALAPLSRPEVHGLRSEGGLTSFELGFLDARGRPRSARVEIQKDAFDVWGVRFEDLTGQPDILESLEDRTPSADDVDLDDDAEEEPPAGALVVRLFDLPERGFVRWTGGMWRYIPVLHLAVAHGLGAARVERVFRLPRMDSVFVHELRRRPDGAFVLVLRMRPFDEDNPFLSKYPEQTSRIVIREDGLEVLAD